MRYIAFKDNDNDSDLNITYYDSRNESGGLSIEIDEGRGCGGNNGLRCNYLLIPQEIAQLIKFLLNKGNENE